MLEACRVRYPIEDIEIVALSEIYSGFIESFECLIKDLKDFLKGDALRQQIEAVNFTYLWISKQNRVLLWYLTLCTDAIHLGGEKKEELLQSKVFYKGLPALKICRMAVHKDFTRQGIGTAMLAFVINIALGINNAVGCRFLTVEAKNAPPQLDEPDRPIHFYKKNGFAVIKERKPSSAYVPMFKDLKPLINEARKTKRGILYSVP